MVELIPYFRRKRPKHIPFGAAHTHIAYIRKYPPGEKNALQIKSLAAYASETNKIIQIQQFGGGGGQLRQLKVNVDFPLCKMYYKLEFRGKKHGFDCKKPNWKDFRQTYRTT